MNPPRPHLSGPRKLSLRAFIRQRISVGRIPCTRNSLAGNPPGQNTGLREFPPGMRLVQVHGMFRKWLKTEVSHFAILDRISRVSFNHKIYLIFSEAPFSKNIGLARQGISRQEGRKQSQSPKGETRSKPRSRDGRPARQSGRRPAASAAAGSELPRAAGVPPLRRSDDLDSPGDGQMKSRTHRGVDRGQPRFQGARNRK